nr:MAG TPA: hypothetical protein [Caudoviricetes sp.]
MNSFSCLLLTGYRIPQVHYDIQCVIMRLYDFLCKFLEMFQFYFFT